MVPDERLDKMAAVVTAGERVISAPASRPMDDARLEAKLRELAGPRADEWIRLVGSLESTRNGGPALSQPTGGRPPRKNGRAAAPVCGFTLADTNKA